MPSIVASSMAKASDDVGDAAVDADDRGGASLAHARLPTMAHVAIRPQGNIRLFRALKAVTSLTLGIVLGRGAAVNSFRRRLALPAQGDVWPGRVGG
jgi:hypothetical protein